MPNKQIFELNSGAVSVSSVLPFTGATSGDAQKVTVANLVQTGLGSGYITSGMIGNNAVVSGSIASGQISINHLASGVLASPVILSGTISSGMLANASVVSGSIGSGQIGHNHLRSGLVQVLTLGSGQVTSGVISIFSVNSGNLSSGSVTSFNIASGSVNQFHISSGAVTSGEIGNNAVVSGSIASGQIGLQHLRSGLLQTIIAGSSGQFQFNAGGILGADSTVTYSSTSGLLMLHTVSTTNPNLVLDAFSSQTANVLTARNSSDVQMASINASGVLTSEVGITFQTLTANGTSPFIAPAPAGNATPSAKGTGHGRSMIIAAGQSDNTTSGATGGDLVLRGGGVQGIAFIRGRVVLADNEGAAIFGSGTVYSGTMAAVYPRNNATRGIQFFPASGYNNNLIEAYNLSGTVGFGVTGSGFAFANSQLIVGFDTWAASGLTIRPFGAGSTSDSEKGIGFGKNLYVEASASDNSAGKQGGDLVLRAGPPTSPASGNGHIYLADRNTATTFVGMPVFMSGTSAPISGRFHVYQSGSTNSFAIFENASSTAANGSHLWLKRGANDAFIANYDADIRFFTANINTERVRISNNSGNLNVRLASGQAANLQEWEDINGLPYSYMNVSGIFFGATNARLNLLNTQASGTVALTNVSQRVQISDCRSGNITYSLPGLTNLSGQMGTYFVFKKVDSSANSMTIIPSSGFAIEGSLSGQTTTTQYQTFRTIWNGSGWFLL